MALTQNYLILTVTGMLNKLGAKYGEETEEGSMVGVRSGSICCFVFAASFLCLQTGAASAASTDVVFLGGLTVTNTSGCTNYDPNHQFFGGSYFVPVVGSTNGSNSTLTFHSGGALGGVEGFTLASAAFTSAFQPVTGTHVYTLAGTYPASVKVTSQAPPIILTTTQKVSVVGAVQGFSFQPSCVVNFTFSGLRDLQP